MSKIKVQDIEPIGGTSPAITVNANRDVDFSAGVSATSFTGDGANLTNLPVDLTNLDAANLSSGIIPDARFPATLPAVNGSNLTGISAGALVHVADYAIPAGQTIAFWTPLTSGSLQNDTRYYLRAHFGQNTAGGHIRVHPHIFDTSNNYQYDTSNQPGSLDTATHYYGGQTGNQSSSDWTVYEGGYYTARFNFELWFTTYTRPHAQSRLFGDDNINAICHGNHFDTSNKDTRRINGLSFSNNWGYHYNDKSRISLYKYSNY